MLEELLPLSHMYFPSICISFNPIQTLSLLCALSLMYSILIQKKNNNNKITKFDIKNLDEAITSVSTKCIHSAVFELSEKLYKSQ